MMRSPETRGGLRYGELFAGAGGLSLGLDRAGLTPVFHAEIAEKPRDILAHHWPDVPLYGDVSALDGRQLVAAHGPIDLLAGGSPCQDLSVAGKRAGLTEGSGTRSSLFHEQIRLWHETGATYLLWENVAGALQGVRQRRCVVGVRMDRGTTRRRGGCRMTGRAWNSSLPARSSRMPSGGKPKPKKRKPSEFARIYGSRERVAWVKRQPCVIAGSHRCWGEIHNAHTETGGVGYKAGYDTIVPLCMAAHELLHNIGVKSFEKSAGVDLKAEAARIAAAYTEGANG